MVQDMAFIQIAEADREPLVHPVPEFQLPGIGRLARGLLLHCTCKNGKFMGGGHTGTGTSRTSTASAIVRMIIIDLLLTACAVSVIT